MLCQKKGYAKLLGHAHETISISPYTPLIMNIPGRVLLFCFYKVIFTYIHTVFHKLRKEDTNVLYNFIIVFHVPKRRGKQNNIYMECFRESVQY